MRSVPETSRAAYESLDPEKISDIHRKILWALSQLMEDATYEEIAAFLKIEKSKVWKRISELLKAGLIYRPGTKKALRSGRAGFCYRLTDAATPKTTAAEKALKGHGIAFYSRNIQAIANNRPLELF